MKKLIFITFLLFLNNMKAQITTVSKFKSVFTIEAIASIGASNYGPGAMLGYYIADEKSIRIGAVNRFFKYKDYSENILEINADYNQAILAIDRYDSTFGRLSFSAFGGFALESVKVTSKTIIIEPYDKYYYAYVGINPEWTINDNLSFNLFLRQFYAINGKKETLGNYRYDAGVSLRYYFN